MDGEWFGRGLARLGLPLDLAALIVVARGVSALLVAWRARRSSGWTSR